MKGIGTLGLVLGLTSMAWGQDRQQPKEPPALGPVLSNPDVQKELKLSEEQIGKLKDALGKVWEKFTRDFGKNQQMSFEELMQKRKEISKDGNKAIAGVLDAKQLKRYKQIEWQMAGIGALGDPELQTELKLRDEQKKKLDGIFADFEKKMYEMTKNREVSREKYRAAGQDAEKKANEVLTEDQKKNFEELKGSPFQFSQPKSGR